MKMYFQKEQVRNVIRNFLNSIDKIDTELDFEIKRNSIINLVLGDMLNSSVEWDNNCQINIGWLGNYFIKALNRRPDLLGKEILDDICSVCFRFLLEYYLSIKDQLSMDFEDARVFVIDNLNAFEPSARERIEYALRDMPISIFKQVANGDEIASIKEFSLTADKAKELKNQWDKEIKQKEAAVNVLKAALDKYENAFNFVGLHQGFDELAKEKVKEKENILYWLRFLSILIVFPILTKLAFIYYNIYNDTFKSDVLVATILPTVSLVGISIYYFRVLLFNYKSVKSQLLQIELRKTLCKFIQSYSSYSKTMKAQDSDSLAKFENIIFSGIISDEEKLPSTYDGMDQIGKLIQSIKK